jgi:hypothetical protein
MDENDTSNGSPGDLPDDIQRWTAKRRAALVMSILKGETTAAEAEICDGLLVAPLSGSSTRASRFSERQTPTLAAGWVHVSPRRTLRRRILILQSIGHSMLPTFSRKNSIWW